MSYVEAIILSIVEGITEFLPISSTGHLVLTSNILFIPQTEFVKSFEIIIQLGAILAIVVLYKSMLLRSAGVWKRIVVAFIPTAIIGFLLYKTIKEYLLGNETVTLWALFIGGIILIIIESLSLRGASQRATRQSHNNVTIEQLSLNHAFLIGVFQSLSIVPGVSRAAATIIGARLLGMNRENAVIFSFLLAVPTMAAATGYDLLKSSFSFSPYEYSVLAAGFIGSFLVALAAIKFFIKYIQHHTLIPFGIYRIILALVYWLVIL